MALDGGHGLRSRALRFVMVLAGVAAAVLAWPVATELEDGATALMLGAVLAVGLVALSERGYRALTARPLAAAAFLVAVLMLAGVAAIDGSIGEGPRWSSEEQVVVSELIAAAVPDGVRTDDLRGGAYRDDDLLIGYTVDDEDGFRAIAVDAGMVKSGLRRRADELAGASGLSWRAAVADACADHAAEVDALVDLKAALHVGAALCLVSTLALLLAAPLALAPPRRLV